MILSDAAELTNTRRVTKDGFLVAEARAARIGVQLYRGEEVERPDLDVVRVFRPEEEVFKDASLASYAYRPVTVGTHPKEFVSSRTWKDVAAGTLSGDVIRDGGFVKVQLALMDADAVDAVQNGGLREISMGYECNLDWTSGVTDDGQPFDCIQRDLRMNHATILRAGRAGRQCALDADSSTPTLTSKEPDMAEATLRTALVDGLEIQTTPQGAQALEKLQRQLADEASKIALKDAEIASIRADHVKAIAAKDGQITALEANYRSQLEAKDGERAALVVTHTSALEAKDGEIAALKLQIPDAATLDARAMERVKVIDAATKLAGKFDPAGKSDVEIRRLAVSSHYGAAFADGTSDDFIAGAFKSALAAIEKAPPADPVRNAIKAGVSHVGDGNPDPKAKWIAHLNNAWKAGNEPAAA